MNRREVFETVKKHLLSQGRKCVDDRERCLYRNNGDRCAIGVLIPDEFYLTTMEHHSVEALSRNHPELILLLNIDCQEDIYFLSDLQNIHDSNSPNIWSTQLELFESKLTEELQKEKA